MKQLQTTYPTDIDAKEIEDSLELVKREMIRTTPEETLAICEAMHVVKALAMSNSEIDPEDVLQYIGIGAYKACFNLSDSWVVKFARDTSVFRREYAAMNAAIQRGLGKLFLDTHVVQSPGIKIWSGILIKHAVDTKETMITLTDGYHRWVKRDPVKDPFTVIIFQRKIDYITKDIKSLYDITETWNEMEIIEAREKGVLPIEPDCRLPEKVTCEYMEDEEMWEDDILRLYGEEFHHAWLQFKFDWNISDLHNENIGYVTAPGTKPGENPYTDIPVMLDWMSEDD